MLHVARLESRYGRIPALKGVDLDVARGELVALVGATGAGKTTLLRVLAGVQPLSGGSVCFEGADIGAASPERRVRLGLAMVPEGRQVFAPLSVEDNLRLGGYTRARAEAEETLAQVYALFPALAERRGAVAGMLSGGQQQMLAIGRALMARPRLLLLDEPSMGLAPKLVAEIFARIRELRATTTVLLVDQNARAALEIADRAYVMETGAVVLSGPSGALARDPQVQRAYLGT